MDNKLSRSLSIGRWLLVAILLPNLAIADECPGPGASLTTVRIAISDFQRNDRAPAGADCAYNLATNYPLDPSNLNSTVLSFFSEAADIQRKAAAKRLAAHRTDDGYKYLDQEIALRRDFLKVALENDSTTGETAQELHRYVVRHLSYLISALAERGQYDKVADELGEQNPKVINMEALQVWLQAVWSCAQWDGQKANLCSDSNREKCKDKIKVFLTSVEGMTISSFPPQTGKDIADLKTLSSTGCLE